MQQMSTFTENEDILEYYCLLKPKDFVGSYIYIYIVCCSISYSAQETIIVDQCRQRERIRLAVDIDECLAYFIPALCKFHNEEYGTELNASSFESYEFHDVWGGSREEASLKMTGFFQSIHFKEKILPINGALEALKWLKEQIIGLELHIVTARQHHLEEHTRNWVEEHFPGVFTELHFGNHYSTPESHEASPRCVEKSKQ